MLQKIRDNTQGLIAKLFVGFVIAVFALFGIDTLVGTFLASSAGIEVNGEEISTLEIDSLAQRKTQEFFSSLGPDADFSSIDETMFREQAINELVQRELLRQSAEESGMAISPAVVDRMILQTPDFQVDGAYDDERASILLRSMGYSPASYRATIASETILNQLIAAYSTSGFATPREMQQLMALLHQKRSFRYLTLSLDAENTDVEIGDEAIAAYYDDNQARFQRAEQVKINWLELDRNSLYDEVEITEEELRQRYQDEVATYQAQTERRAAHILLEAAGEEEFDAAEAEAEALRERIEQGEDFAALAAEYSDDLGSAEDGGDVGYTSGDSFVPEFEQALQGLEVGQVSEPVRSEFGIHLIKLLELNETEIDSFEQRREELERELKSSEVDDLFLARSEELSNLAFESFDLMEPAEAMGLELHESDWFDRSGGTGVTAFQGVAEASFSTEVLEDGLNSELIQIDDDRSVVVHVIEHREAEVLPLEEVRGEIVVALRLQRMREQARQIGETIVSSLQAGDNISSLLETQGLSWTEMESVERDSQRVHPAILEQVFSLAPPAEGETNVEGFQLPSGEYVVVELRSVSDGGAEDLEEGEEQNMRNFLSQQDAALDFTSYMRSLENRAEISGMENQLNQDELF